MNTQAHLSADVLDRLVLGALPEADRTGAESHLSGCTRCSGDLATLRADMQHFTQFVMPRTQEPVRARLEQGRSWNLGRMLAPAFGLLAAGTLAIVIVNPRVTGTRPPARYEGVKGGPILSVYALAQGAQQPAELPKKGQLAAGDKIRFVAEPSGYEYLLIASIDGQGAVEAYYPPQGKRSAPLEPGKQALPGAIELDAAPGTERIYAFFSHAPLDLSSVADGLKSHPEAPPQPAGAAPVQVFTFDKVQK